MFHTFSEELALKGSTRFHVRARPGARRTAARAVMDDGSIKIDVASVPEDGKANVELLRYVSEQFAVPVSNVRIVRGVRGRVKLIEVESEAVKQ